MPFFMGLQRKHQPPTKAAEEQVIGGNIIQHCHLMSGFDLRNLLPAGDRSSTVVRSLQR